MTGRVPRPTPVERAPRWPELDDSAAADLAVASALAANLRRAMGDLSARQLATQSGVSNTVITRFLAGHTWPDIATVAKLEHALGADLWPAGVARKTPQQGTV